MERKRIGIIGCGAMGLYVLKGLVRSRVALEIEIFDAADEPGAGMPYGSRMNADYMLCNAFSREIPSFTRSLVDWLETRPTRELGEWELGRDDIGARAFYPRTLIGEYLQSEFDELRNLAEHAGHRVVVRAGTCVQDVRFEVGRITVICESASVSERVELDDVVLATGHLWPEQPGIDGARLQSPWPHTEITNAPAGPIGILGSSLSAVDIVVALGHAHGEFVEQGDRVLWAPGDGGEALRITMVSRNGVMPEGDFYYPFPYRPLRFITPEAVAREVEQGCEGLLERVFKLLLQELDAADPDYLPSLGEEARTIEGFSAGYFREREEKAGLEAVRDDFAEVRASMRRKETIPSRYALLRGHEHFEIVLPLLEDEDWKRFAEHLLPVFSDCYAALPHLSIARVLALYDAGVLSLVATGADASFASLPSGEVEVTCDAQTMRFDRMFDARGQSSAPRSELPFPSLAAILVDGERPIVAPFRLSLAIDTDARLYCLALPQVLERHPFSQGLPNCASLADIVVRDLMAAGPVPS